MGRMRFLGFVSRFFPFLVDSWIPGSCAIVVQARLHGKGISFIVSLNEDAEDTVDNAAN